MTAAMDPERLLGKEAVIDVNYFLLMWRWNTDFFPRCSTLFYIYGVLYTVTGWGCCLLCKTFGA